VTLAEVVLIRVGGAVVKSALKSRLGDTSLAASAGSSVIDLLTANTRDPRDQTRGALLIEQIRMRVADSILAVFRAEGSRLDNSSQEAVALAVADTLDASSISAAGLANLDFDQSKLTKSLLASGRKYTRDFSEAEVSFYRRIVAECSQVVVNVASKLPAFNESSFAEVLKRESELLEIAHSLLADARRNAPHVPALSPIPMSTRPFVDAPLIGREADLAWVRDTPGDRLLIGVPGSGKTFLLTKLVQEGWGLFVVSDDIDAIAREVKERSPSIVILDDAHLNLDLIRKLFHLRQIEKASFTIVSTSWPGAQHEVSSTMVLPGSRARELNLLTRDEIVEVVRGTGLLGSNELIREIVNQAEGKPGLAVTLAHLCHQGDVRDVALGDALGRLVGSDFRRLVGEQATEVLAAFALGGDAGMPIDAVAQGLGLAAGNVRRVVGGLAAGGVITETRRRAEGDAFLSVRPPVLRGVLIRDVFYNTPARPPVVTLIENAPELTGVAHSLIDAYARGATIPFAQLTGLLERANSREVWEHFAQLGEAEAEWIVENHRELAISLAAPLLYRVPHRIVPTLLNAAVGDRRDLGPHLDHPLRLIRDWIEDTEPSAAEATDRRRILLRATRAWIQAGNDPEVGMHALSLVMRPRFERGSTDPGLGRTVTFRVGLLTNARLVELQALWPEVRDGIKATRSPTWRHILDSLYEWAYPQTYSGVSLPAATLRQMRQTADTMIADLVEVAGDHQGVCRKLAEIATGIGLSRKIEVEPAFGVLYPVVRDLTAYSDQSDAVRKLASELIDAEPSDIARLLDRYEREAGDVGLSWPRMTPTFCTALADAAVSPTAWLRALLEVSASGDLLEPFLHAAAAHHDADWESLAAECLSRPNVAWIAIGQVLTMQLPPPDLLERVLRLLPSFAQGVEILCVRGQIAPQTLGLALNHDNEKVALAAAVGIRAGGSLETLDVILREQWRGAILRSASVADKISDSDSYWLREIFRADPPLSFDWVSARLQMKPHEWRFAREELDSAALGVLDATQRIRVMDLVGGDRCRGHLIAAIVGDDLITYQHLLERRELSSFHLMPLSGRPVGAWIAKAKAALNFGYEPKRVAMAAFQHFGNDAEWGELSAHWQSWVEPFQQLCALDDERLAEVGRVGVQYASAQRDKEARIERNERVYGD
jgi:hypothetical protein